MDLTRSPKWKPRNTLNTLKRLAASRRGVTPNPPWLLATMEPRLSCGSCISWFLYFAVRGRNALATLPVLTLLRRSCRAAAENVELVDASEGTFHVLSARVKPTSSQLQARYKCDATVILRRCYGDAFVFPSYSLRILFVFSWCFHGILLVFPGGPLRHTPAAAPSDYFVLTGKG